MRYSVIAKGLTSAQAESEIRKAGISDIKPARLLGQFFCELSEEQVKAFTAVPGVVLKPIKDYRADQVLADVAPVESLSDLF